MPRSSTPRLVQPWESAQLNRRIGSDLEWATKDEAITLGGIFSVLLLGFVAQTLDSGSAPLALAGASWGFLALIHWRRGSPAPSRIGLLPALPLAFLLILMIGMRSDTLDGRAWWSLLGGLGGWAAFATATHLGLHHPMVSRRVLWGALVLGVLYVGMTSAIRAFTLTEDDSSSPSFAVILQALGTQADIISVAVMCLCLGLALAVQAVQAGQGLSWGALIAFLPLTIPIAAARYACLLAAALFVLALYHIVRGSAPSSPRPRLASAWLAGLTLLCLLGAFFIKRDLSLAAPEVSLIEVFKQAYPLGQPLDPAVPVDSVIHRLVLQFGWAGSLFIGLSLLLLARHRFLDYGPPGHLSCWCGLAAAIQVGIALEHDPFAHPFAIVFGLIMLLLACGPLDEAKPSEASRSPQEDHPN